MAAGMKYDLKPIQVASEMCRFDTVYRLSGGFNLVLEGLSMGERIAPLTPLAIDFATRKATVIKNVQVVQGTKATDTTVKVSKGSLAYVGMVVGSGTKGATITNIDTSDDGYNLLTLDVAVGKLAVGDILFESSDAEGKEAKHKAVALNYAWTVVEPGATITAIGGVYEIRPTALLSPISDRDRESLGDRFLFTH